MPPIQSDKYQCRIYCDFLLMMGTWMPETCREETEINIFKQNCAPSWITCETDNSPCLAEVKNACRCNISAPYVFMARYLFDSAQGQLYSNFTLAVSKGAEFIAAIFLIIRTVLHTVTATGCTWPPFRYVMHELNSRDTLKILRHPIKIVIVNSESIRNFLIREWFTGSTLFTACVVLNYFKTAYNSCSECDFLHAFSVLCV